MSAISDPIHRLPDPPVANDLDFDDKADVFLPALVLFSEELEVFRQAINFASGQLVAYVGTYINGTSFTIPIDASSWAMVGGRIKADCGGNGIKYATIISITVLNSVTTVVVSGDTLMNPISSIRFFSMEANTTPNHKSIHAAGSRDAIAPTDIGAAPTSHAKNDTTYGAASEENYGHVQLGTATPEALGTATKGSATRAAKEDHVHPTTGLMTDSHPANNITGFGSEPPAIVNGTSGAAGSADSVSRSDHSHDLGQHTHVDNTTGGNLLSSVEPPAVDSSTSGKIGTATQMARADHSHDLGPHTHADAATGGNLLATTEPGEVKSSTSGKVGTKTLLARADHSHDLGTHTHGDDTTGGIIDHGSLTGCEDDDHTQYLLIDGTRALTGPLSCPYAPVDGNSLINRTYADNILAAQDAMVFKGVIDCSTNPVYPAADCGHTYKVNVAGKIGGIDGPKVEINDTLICITDSTVAGIHANVGSAWVILQNNIDISTLITKNIGTTTGDLITFSGPSVPVRLGIGTDEQVLMSIGGTLFWGFPSKLAASLIGIDPERISRNDQLGTAAYLDQTWLYASTTWDAPSCANAAQVSTTVAVPGVEIGDKVLPSASLVLSGLNLRGEVTATDVVTLYLSNFTGSAVDLSSATYHVAVLKRAPAR